MRALTAAALILASATAVLTATVPAIAEPKIETPHEVFNPDGTIQRLTVKPETQPKVRSLAAAPSRLKPVEINGPSENRIDLVILGDGFTADQQTDFATETDRAVAAITEREPYKTYRKLFNIWRIEIDSPESGVSGDPTADVKKNTPLGAAFFCGGGGTERALCVDTTAVWQYATALLPQADQLLVMANSTKYGGVGYDRIGTFSRNVSATETVLHELGHSQGRLADEYDYDGPEVYVGDEPVEANVTINAAGAKWQPWLGEPTPDGGVIGAFEGGKYSRKGIYRPSDNSLMRSLGQQFSLVNREKMVQSFYSATRPVDSVSTPAGQTHNPAQPLVVKTTDQALTVEWTADGQPVAAWNGKRTLTPADLAGVGKDTFALKLTVTDPTSFVRNTAYKQDLTQTLAWTVAKNNGNGATATFAKTGDWGSGWEGGVTVKAGLVVLPAWKVEFDVPAGFAITSAWDADMVRSGDHYTFTSKSWAGPLNPGATARFGLVGSPGNFPGPLNCTLNGNPCN
ncbi:M64 family metallopeptidase [Nonomuraea sp. NPDC050556]|uniref:M64 family metallopeptidase n=1 Tax=Nonomuraea sp. NPDC050556 TaxID=3364369 RepID=UPI00379C6C07